MAETTAQRARRLARQNLKSKLNTGEVDLERIETDPEEQRLIKQRIKRPEFEETRVMDEPGGQLIESKDIPVHGEFRRRPPVEPALSQDTLPLPPQQNVMMEDLAAKMLRPQSQIDGVQTDMISLSDISPGMAPLPERAPASDGGSMNTILQAALIQAIPTLVGEMFGGTGGGAIGAKAGQLGVSQLVPTREQAFKEQKAVEAGRLGRARIASSEKQNQQRIQAARDLESLRQTGRLKTEEFKATHRQELEKLKNIGRADLIDKKFLNTSALTNIRALDTRSLEKLKQIGRLDILDKKIMSQKEITNIRALDTRSLEKLKQIGRLDILKDRILGQKEITNMRAFDAKDLEKLKQIGRLDILKDRILGQKELANIKAFDAKDLEKVKQKGRLGLLDKKTLSQKELANIKAFDAKDLEKLKQIGRLDILKDRILSQKELANIKAFDSKDLEKLKQIGRLDILKDRILGQKEIANIKAFDAKDLEKLKQMGRLDLLKDRILGQKDIANIRNESLGLRKKGLDLRKEVIDLRKSKKLDRDVETLSKRVEKAKVPSVINTFKRLKALIPGGLSGSQDIPGYGMGTGGLPDFAVSEEGREIRQTVAEFSNLLSRINLGTAQTTTELRRLAKQLGEGAFKTDKQLRDGLRNALSIIQSELQNIETATPEALQEFRNRGGVTSEDDVFKITAPPKEDPIITKPYKGRLTKFRKLPSGEYEIVE